MPQKVIKFAGINRRVNEFQNIGACEELVNLRTDVNSSLHVTKPKRVVRVTTSLAFLHEHSWGDKNNLIGVTNSGNLVLIKDNGEDLPIFKDFSTSNITISHAGNTLVAYNADDNKQVVFKFEDDRYKTITLDLPVIKDISVSYTYQSNNPARGYALPEEATAAGFNAAMTKAASMFYTNYNNGLCGAVVVGCTYELNDGSEIWSTSFVVLDATRIEGFKTPTYESNSEGTWRVMVYGASKATLELSLDGTKSKEVRCINVYATRPVLPFESNQNNTTSYELKRLTLDELNLDGQIMYFQGKISVYSTKSSMLLNFGTQLAGEAIMPVTSGCLTRKGEMVSYNNRFHYFDSESIHEIQHPTVSGISTDAATDEWVAYVRFNDEWKLINHIYKFSVGDVKDFIYPMADVDMITFVKGSRDGDDVFSVPFNDGFSVKLKNSRAYNYSFAFDVTIELDQNVDKLYDTVIESGQLWGNGFDKSVMWKDEANAINVSAQYNPFVFNVNNSYSFGGEVLDLATSYIPISSTQIGQYPLTVFTTNGIFSMAHGDGNTLYSSIIPIQPLVISGKVKSTPYGIFFVSYRNLYTLVGRDVVCISDNMSGPLEDSLRKTDAFKALCYSGSDDHFDFTTLLSAKDFDEIISNAMMAYDPLHNELYISSNDDNVEYKELP